MNPTQKMPSNVNPNCTIIYYYCLDNYGKPSCTIREVYVEDFYPDAAKEVILLPASQTVPIKSSFGTKLILSSWIMSDFFSTRRGT